MAMLVIAILFGMTLPLASALAGRFRLGSARDAFVNTHARARSAAIQYGRTARFHIEAERSRFWIEVDTGRAGSIAADTIGQVIDIRRDYGGVTMFAPRRILCFDSRGLAYLGGACESHDAMVTFERQDRVDTVRLSLGGTVVNP